MFNHCFYSVLDLQLNKYYNKYTENFDFDDGSDVPFLTLEEAQKIAKTSSNFKICLHENT